MLSHDMASAIIGLAVNNLHDAMYNTYYLLIVREISGVACILTCGWPRILTGGCSSTLTAVYSGYDLCLPGCPKIDS